MEKNTKLLIGLMILMIAVSGCTTFNYECKVGNYECKVGNRISDNCYTDFETNRFTGVFSLYYGEYSSFENLLRRADVEIEHLTQSHCLYEEMEIIKFDIISINDSSIEIKNNSKELIFENDNKTDKDIFVDIIYTYRWRRPIWNKETSFKICIPEIRKFGELIE